MITIKHLPGNLLCVLLCVKSFKSQHSLASINFVELLTHSIPDRYLRSSTLPLLVAPKSRLVMKGHWTFAFRAPL